MMHGLRQIKSRTGKRESALTGADFAFPSKNWVKDQVELSLEEAEK